MDAPAKTPPNEPAHTQGGGAGPPEPDIPVRDLPRDVGYLLLAGGLIGVVAPGILGLDMLALGTLILWPGNQRRVERWLQGDPSTPKFLRGSLKQVERFLDNLEKRYPRLDPPKPGRS
ncbi:hypothetical protein [Methylomagnum ishizawai]|uniref:hypothetical protein n=1 Tax=Methylomagnum ishizawai TaxID=1760988 RepID=UPI001C33F25C|nr:hypothetical protein [Methylomagnum ishizawai]BBL74270.1 hypothetical protein MishRS11D_13680 [Methylomagnum ishizawai]